MKTLYTPTGAMLLALFMNACSTPGCTDANSVNYNPEATKDDGSCKYEGKHVFWYDEEAADGLINDGTSALIFYVDGEVIGSQAASIYWTSAPECNQESSITDTKDLGSYTSQSYSYEVRAQSDGWLYWDGVLNYNANTCTAIQLSWSKVNRR